jgi:hypothetical protein
MGIKIDTPDSTSPQTTKEWVNLEKFEKELIQLINKHSIENGSDTPDFILAEYLVSCLINYQRIVKSRNEWYKK